MVDFKIFYISLVKAFLALFIVLSPILYFNIIVDPYGVFFGNYVDSRLEPNKRYMKMNHVLSHPERYKSFIFGSSRVNAIDPDKIIGYQYYNMTYSSGTPRAHYQDICNMLAHGVKIENLLIALDVEGVLYAPEVQESDLLRKQPPSNFLEKIRFFNSYVAYIPSWNYIKMYYTKSSPLIDRSLVFENGITYNSFFDSLNFKTKIIHNCGKQFLNPSGAKNFPARIEFAFKEIKKIMDIARENDINIQFYMNPIHAKTILNLNLDSYYEALKTLSELTDFVDFSYFNSVTTNNLFYFETSHFNQKAGDLVIARLFNQYHPELPSDFGRRVTSANIAKHIEFHKAQVNKYFQDITIEENQTSSQITANISMKNTDIQWTIDTINGICSSNVSSPYSLSGPLLHLKGRTHTERSNMISDRLFIKINKQYFSIHNVSISNDDSLNTTWEISIKTNQLDQGEPFVEMALLSEDDKQLEISRHNQRIQVVPSHVKISDLRKDSIDNDMRFVIDQINGQKSNYKIDYGVTPFLNISGWVKNKKGQNPMDNIFITFAGKEYPLQFLNFRKGLVVSQNDNSMLMAGWIAKIPCSDLEKGKYELEFKVVNRDGQSYWTPQKKYAVDFITAFSEDLLSNAIKSTLSTRIVVDNINGGRGLSGGVVIEWKTIEMRGWAVDDPLNSAALGLVVKIGDRYFSCNYGLARDDVANAFNNQAFANSGWSVSIPKRDLEAGEHAISFLVLSKDGKSYYDKSPQFYIIIEK